MTSFKTSCLISALCIILIYTSTAHADARDSVLGIWNNKEKDAQIEIFHCGGKYCGKIVWGNKPLYSADENRAQAGLPRRDNKNPNPDLGPRFIIGLQIMSDFEYDGDYRWVGGKVYDPKSGKTYSGEMTLVTSDRLELR